MKLLLDENVPKNIMSDLKRAGHDVEHINTNCKGKQDDEVLDYAVNNKRCIITLDSDFCGFKKKEHYGIIKVSSKLFNPQEPILEVLKMYKGSSLKDVYVQIDEKSAFKEIKKYGKKRKLFLKQFQRIQLELECFSN